jgi:hypothetical protein
MQLDAKQSENLLNWIKTHWLPNAKCPMCDHSQWGVNDAVFEMREFFQGNMVIGGKIIPVVPISCSHCGNTIFLNALQIGLIANNLVGKK